MLRGSLSQTAVREWREGLPSPRKYSKSTSTGPSKEKNRNPMVCESKGIVIGSVPENSEVMGLGMGPRPCWQSRERDRFLQGIRFTFIHDDWQECLSVSH